MLRVGITGGIGSGKTTVCQIFERLGVPVYYADVRAKELMEDDADLVRAIKENFGEAMYVEGKLQRSLLAEKVFQDEHLLLIINSLVHPVVARDCESWNEVLAKKNYPYTLRESALLVETGVYKSLNKLIVVTAPLEDRIKRVMARDGQTAAQVEARIKAQLPEAEKAKLANYVIHNNEIMDLVPQVAKIHQDLVRLN